MRNRKYDYLSARALRGGANEGRAMNVTFRGGCVEDESGAKWWSAELLAKVEKERDEARASVADAYRRGAEDMREAAAQLFDGKPTVPGLATMPPYADAIRALPVPEDTDG